jgi:hypothetical protein
MEYSRTVVMKNGSKTKTYSVIAALLLLASCNEKVNPSLQNSNTTVTPPPVATPDKYFRLVNTSDTMLGYHLHKSGAGNHNTKCEVNAASFSTALYAGANATYDITCFLEAEELALFYNGLQWNIEASPNTCEYIGYAPFSFYQYQPGDSTRTVSYISCPAGLGTVPGNRPNCGGYYQEEAPFNSGAPFLQIDPATVGDEQSLCRFDYDSEGPNCDEGEITIIDRAFDYPVAGDPLSGPPSEIGSTTRKISCNGKANNCANGPIRDVDVLSEVPWGNVNTKTDLASETSLRYVVSSPYSKKFITNRYIANFMRQCSGANYDHGAYGFGSPFLGFNPSQTTFNPRVADLLAKNYRRDYSNTNLFSPIYDYMTGAFQADPAVDPMTLNPQRFFDQNEKVRALASSPMSGQYNDIVNAAKGARGTNPFYGFYCLNNARDVKARIRVVVREWDRSFSIDPIMDVMSDIYNGLDSLMDNHYDHLGNLDPYDNFNDVADWDDRLKFITPLNTGVPANDIPACQYPYESEHFSRENFPEKLL